jgi:hypothetical protein
MPLFLAGACASAAPAPSVPRDETKQQITILHDAFGKPSPMEKDWGFAALIEYRGKHILFDTGDNPDILARNAKAKGVDLSNLDFAVLSHRHGDHMGGLDHLLAVNPHVKIYATKENFGVYRPLHGRADLRRAAEGVRGAVPLRRWMRGSMAAAASTILSMPGWEQPTTRTMPSGVSMASDNSRSSRVVGLSEACGSSPPSALALGAMPHPL